MDQSRQELIINLLDRIAENALLIPAQNLETKPADLLWLKELGLLVNAPLADEVICPGCAEACPMPVRTASSAPSQFFVTCDKDPEIGRVPIRNDLLTQWRIHISGLARLICRYLKLDSPREETGRWRLGLVKGRKHRIWLWLDLGQPVVLAVNDNAKKLSELMFVDNGELKLDQNTIRRMVDAPESSIERYIPNTDRCKKRKQDTQAKHDALRVAAHSYRKKPQGKSETWVAKQLQNTDISQNYSLDHIRKIIRQ